MGLRVWLYASHPVPQSFHPMPHMSWAEPAHQTSPEITKNVDSFKGARSSMHAGQRTAAGTVQDGCLANPRQDPAMQRNLSAH